VAAVIDLRWSRHCPRREQCSACGSGGDLGTETVEASDGIFCVTLCDSCSDYADLIDWSDIRDRVVEHCGHVGVSIEEMAVLLSAGRVVSAEADKLRVWPWL
jgi:hypothetical protein